MTKEKNKMTGCPITYGMNMFGDKWSLIIIRDMALLGKRYYGDFLKSSENISTNILADRLVSLEEKGIILKKTDETNRSKNIYSLTEKGKDLIPLLVSIADWAIKYDEDTTAPKEFINKVKKDQKAVVKEILKSLEKEEPFLKLND
jgi:DNA-binding HxlR family transcriptional regulator